MHFVDHRHEVVVRRTKFELDEAEKRAHILEGLKKALENIDAVIVAIKKSKSAEDAKIALKSGFQFSDLQAQAILVVLSQAAGNEDLIGAFFRQRIQRASAVAGADAG